MQKQRKSLKEVLQKQPFADVIQNRFSQKFRKLHWKRRGLESLFNKFVGYSPATLLE